LLLSLCRNVLRNKGIDIKKMFGIDTGKTDFFDRPLSSGETSNPGICEIR
jgi:hypothetical protein